MNIRCAFRTGLLSVGLTLGLFGCSSDGSSSPNDGTGGTGSTRNVEIFSWWIAPGEAEAWQALVDVNKQLHPNDHVYNAAADSGDDARAELATRLEAGKPPDLFQLNSQDLGPLVGNYPGALQPLDALVEKQKLRETIPPDILRDVSVSGSVYAMPLNIHRENSLFYNKQILKENGLEPPDSVESLLAACKKLKAAGVTPLATVYQGWVLRILFNGIAMGSMGAESFDAYMRTGQVDAAKLKTAIAVFDEVLQNYVNDDAADPEIGWTDAAEMVSNGEAAMFLHGDWAKGYYVQLGWTPGVDFGVNGAPGAADMFWYSVDTFAMPVGSQNPTGAENFLETVGSVKGQVAFNRLKGSTPVRNDIPRSALDSEGSKTLDDFHNAKFRTAIVNQTAWEDALLAFATSHDQDAVYQAYVAHPPQ